MALDIRLAMGRRWLKLVGGIEAGLADKFVDAVGIVAPDPTDRADAAVAAHREAWQTLAAVAGRAMDGWALYEHLTSDPTHHAHDLVTLDDPTNTAAVEEAEIEFVKWYEALFYQPAGNTGNAWLTPAELGR